MSQRVPHVDSGFQDFWSRYPRRVAKAEARKAWVKLNPSPQLVAQILAALDWQRHQPDWLKDDGQYVPYPASWLRGERWEDEPPARPQTTKSAFDVVRERLAARRGA